MPTERHAMARSVCSRAGLGSIGNYPGNGNLANKGGEQGVRHIPESGIWKLFRHYLGDILSSGVGGVHCAQHSPQLLHRKSRICNGRTLGSVRQGRTL